MKTSAAAILAVGFVLGSALIYLGLAKTGDAIMQSSFNHRIPSQLELVFTGDRQGSPIEIKQVK